LSTYRSFVFWAVGIAVVLIPFGLFVLLGWPGAADSCTTASPDTCYCEAFTPADVATGNGGVRQPSNTWFNLYAIGTSFLVAMVVFFDRRGSRGEAPIQSTGLIPDAYVLAVLFLGLGSMWFHASLKAWAGNIDGLSMYVYAGFLVFYTVRRLWASDVFFWTAYPATVAAFTTIGAVWQWEYKSAVLIAVLVVAYLALEIGCWYRQGTILMGRTRPRVLWGCAVGAIVVATVFWLLSQTGGPLCDPASWAQPHGLLWHPLAGLMAVLLYFYWREEKLVA